MEKGDPMYRGEPLRHGGFSDPANSESTRETIYHFDPAWQRTLSRMPHGERSPEAFSVALEETHRVAPGDFASLKHHAESQRPNNPLSYLLDLLAVTPAESDIDKGDVATFIV